MAAVDMESFEPNSNKYKSEKREESQRVKLNSVVKNGSVSTKKPMAKRIAENFISGDPEKIASDIWYDTIIPGAKNLFLDIMSMIFFGERTNRSRKNGYYSYRGRDSYYEDYSSYYEPRRRGSREDDRRRTRSGYRDIVLTDRKDAEAIIDAMRGRIREFGSVSLAELYDLVNLPSMDYTDNNWGWDDSRDIGIRRVSNGYHLDLTDVKYLP